MVKKAKKKVIKKKKKTIKKKKGRSLKRKPAAPKKPKESTSSAMVVVGDQEADITNPQDVLALIRDVLVGKPVDVTKAKQAIEQVFAHHEDQLRLFLVATAKSKLDRVVRASEFISKVEDRLFTDATLGDATTSQLIKLYAFAHGAQHEDLDFVKKVADTNLEIQKILGVVNAGTDLQNKIKNILDDTPQAESRTRIRDAVEKCLAVIKTSEVKTLDVPAKEQSK